tara:strand:- start:3709 stop:3882 length:174 start_codon:yes stop_codon:yes gene_type:complete
MEDTVRTAGVGVGGIWATMWEFLPELIRLLIGIVTLIYMVIKVKKELTDGKTRKRKE